MAKDVRVYSSVGWGSCKSVKEFLTAKGVPFIGKDIADPGVLDELQQVAPGAMGLPVIVIDGQVIFGFDRTRLQKALGIQ